MSIVQLRIELPTYARSFSIQVHDSASILEVKEEISRICPGRPRVDGQKLIWRGRFLADSEKVETIWKSPSEPRIVHLSVHPSAWIAGPPTVQQPTPTRAISSPNLTSTTSYSANQSLPVPTPQSGFVAAKLPFILAKHEEAITVLTEGQFDAARAHAMSLQRNESVILLESNGWSWPSILDQSYPAVTPGGLEYKRVVIGNTPYLALQNDGSESTPAQAHALRVLSYTFSILSKEIRKDAQSLQNHTIPQGNSDRQTVPEIPHINDLLQQMGLPPLHHAPNVEGIQGQEQLRAPNLLPEIPIRPLLAPLFMLAIRTALLLYFVAPARKPIFGVLIIAWMLYEIWQPIRHNLLRQLREQAPRRNERNELQGPGAPARPAVGPADPGPNDLPMQRQFQSRALMEMLGNMNVETEQRVLADATSENPMEPGLGHKITTFVSLLITTLHPAIWNQRRMALRSREGSIRTEVNTRNAQRRTELEDEEARMNEERAEEARRTLRERNSRRPQWMRRYIERVMNAEWVDEAD